MPGRRIILLIAAIAAIGSVIASGALSKKRELQDPRIPPVSSIIKTIEIIGTTVIDDGTPGAGVSVEIRNNSDKAVMAVDLVAGEGAITRNGLTDFENPIVVIPPYGTTTIEMTFSAMTPGAPLVVSAVTYHDGTEEGAEESLRIMHKIRDRDRRNLQEWRAKQKEYKP